MSTIATNELRLHRYPLADAAKELVIPANIPLPNSELPTPVESRLSTDSSGISDSSSPTLARGFQNPAMNEGSVPDSSAAQNVRESQKDNTETKESASHHLDPPGMLSRSYQLVTA